MQQTDYSALRRGDWSNRQRVTEERKRLARESLDSMAQDLDGARVALTDLALGHRVVLVYDARQRKHIEPTPEQAQALREDESLLPALVETGQARVYLKSPDVTAIKLLMGYVMGQVPTPTEVTLRDELLQAREDHALLARALREYVPAQYLAPVSAELRRIAGHHGEEEPAD